jgi:hypothetical protein
MRCKRFAALGTAGRLATRVVAYAILIEAGLFASQILFAPGDPFALFPAFPAR